MQHKKKILVVEDEVAIAQDLQDILLAAGFDVPKIAYTYNQAITHLAGVAPDLVFLDIALRGNKSGLQVADVINAIYKIPFIFLTSFSDQHTVQEVVARNPSGYLVKPYKEKDIAPAVALAFANNRFQKKSVFPAYEYINQFLDKALSPQEYVVLHAAWEGKKNTEIATALFVSVNTIKTHLIRIYQKLQVNSRASAIHKVMNL
ncbi:MAG: response regulator transcription factor [Bacteroidota bacterium]